MKRRIYIDVDGVLNFDKKCRGSIDKRVFFTPEESYIVRLNPEHGQWLLELAEETDAELTWATTWMNMANDHIGPAIGLPELPYVDFGLRKFSQSSGSWKANGVIDYCDGPFFWFDDDWTIPGILSYSLTVPHKVQIVNGYAGLTRQDIESAKRWFSKLDNS